MASSQSLLSDRLRYLRAASGISQEALAEKSGRSIEAISNLERGKASPSLDTLEVLAKALGVHVVDLLTDANASPHEEAIMKLVVSARQLKPKELAVALATIEALVTGRR